MISALFSLPLLVIGAQTSARDNGVRGDPELQCFANSMLIHFDTDKEFEGHVYVKGHYNERSCRVDATLQKHVNLTVPFSKCNVRRERSASPRGLYMYVTVIITFHPMFLTKIDKSFHLKCFYTESDRTVTTRLDVSLSNEQEKKIFVLIGDGNHKAMKESTKPNDGMNEFNENSLSDEVITQQIALPNCSYQVLMDGPYGPPIKYTAVGQQVYHQWSCTYEDGTVSTSNLYCSTVHSCVVKEESGKEVQLLDENGCTLDSYLLDNLYYTSDLTGGQHSQRTSDNCTSKNRMRRLAISKLNKNDGSIIDVFSQPLTVFDIDDRISADLLKKLEVTEFERTICLSSMSFGILIVLFSVELIISIFSVALLCRKASKSHISRPN